MIVGTSIGRARSSTTPARSPLSASRPRPSPPAGRRNRCTASSSGRSRSRRRRVSPPTSRLEPRRVDQVAARERADARHRVVPLADLALSFGCASTRSTTLASRPTPAENRNIRPLTEPRSTRFGLPVVGHQQQALGRVDDVGRDPEHPAVDVRAAAGEAAQRRVRAGEAVGGLVHGAVAAERDDHVVALARRLAGQLGGVVARLGVDRSTS